uniref:Salt-induced protein P3 n=1 Tax=Dunaliella salina TaxID=3046 RepID=Q9ATK8_DUNSA|nr:salt-induced protein P3 [Dunaliella salina]
MREMSGGMCRCTDGWGCRASYRIRSFCLIWLEACSL